MKDNIRNRAWRRKQDQRVEQKAFRKALATSWFDWGKTTTERLSLCSEFARTQKNHLKNCSCFMCGNPRKKMFKGRGKSKLTMQELKAFDVFKSQDF